MGELFDKAYKYAVKHHEGQRRKDGTDFIQHPIEVTNIASTITNDEEVLASAMLHDVPEECKVAIEEIKLLFGDRVGRIVSLETEPFYPYISKQESWKLRKQEAIKRLSTTDEIGFKIVYLSDKLSNIRSLYNDYNRIGTNAFAKFNVSDMNTQAWYYYNVLANLSELKDTEAYKEFEEKLNHIFKDIRRVEDDKRSNTL